MKDVPNGMVCEQVNKKVIHLKGKEGKIVDGFENFMHSLKQNIRVQISFVERSQEISLLITI